MSPSDRPAASNDLRAMAMVRRLRPEARPLGWADLDASQQNAFREIVAWLSSATEALDRRNAREKDEPLGDDGRWLDRDRASRIVTLAGARGTGKTTALLSLINACRLFRRGGSEKEGYPEDLTQALKELGPKLVWLEPLDLEPMPKSTNLLAAILARIDAEVKRPGGGAGAPAWIGRTFPAPQRRDPLLDLMRLQTDVALAWDGNLTARGGQLDPDVYATEVMRAESARLMLNRRLADLLDDLAELVLGNRDLLFVLPIDDCDLNPALAVLLLRLLRMISAPRLFTVVLADELMGRTVFKLKYQGELMEVAAPTGVQATEKKPLEGVADQVGMNALRKLLPPGQRVYLSPMRARTALNYRNGPETPSIGDLLRSFRLPSLWDRAEDLPQSTRPMFNFIGKLPLEPGDYTAIEAIVDIIDAERLVFRPAAGETRPDQNRQRRRSAYSGRAFFREPARRVVDLWARLYSIQGSELNQDEWLELRRATEGCSEEELEVRLHTAREWKKIRLFLNYLAERSRQTIQEEPPLDPWVGQIIEEMIEPNWEGDYELDAHYLKLVPPPVDLVPTRVKIEEPGERQSLSQDAAFSSATEETDRRIRGFVDFQEVNDWYLEVKDPTLEQREREVRVTRSLRAALTLFSDHVAMYDRERLARGSIRPDPLKLGCAVVHWRSGDGSLDHRVHWPAPDWESLWPYDLLTTAWSEAVRWLNPRKERPEADKIEFFAFVWILNATCLAARVIPRRAPGRIPPTPEDWGKLVAATAELIPISDLSRRHRHITSWLLHLPCLLSPETGLPPSIAEHFVGSDGRRRNSVQKRLLEYWCHRDTAEAIRFARADVMGLETLEDAEAGRELAVRFGALEFDMPRTSPNDHPINRIHDGRLRPRMYRSSAAAGARDRRKSQRP